MDEGQIRKIIHIDMDAFYASVEQRDEPTLKGKPVAVGYPAKRGVVAAASYEARGFGVHSAMPSTVAIRKCAELVFVPPRFDVYREVSKQIHAVFKNYTRFVEPLSLDEAYLDVTDNLKGMSTAWETAKEIRARIYDETRLTASAGISCNKFLAKLASDYRKPNGQFAIMPDQAEAFVATLPVAKFHGVGPKTTSKMRALGIETGADLRRQTLDFLQERFGKSGSWYYNIARGWDERPVQPDRERKSLGSETTFPEDRTDPVQIEAGVIAMADDVWAWCEKANSHGPPLRGVRPAMGHVRNIPEVAFERRKKAADHFAEPGRAVAPAIRRRARRSVGVNRNLQVRVRHPLTVPAYKHA